MTECPVYGIVAPSLWGTEIARATDEQKISVNNINFIILNMLTNLKKKQTLKD